VLRVLFITHIFYTVNDGGVSTGWTYLVFDVTASTRLCTRLTSTIQRRRSAAVLAAGWCARGVTCQGLGPPRHAWLNTYDLAGSQVAALDMSSIPLLGRLTCLRLYFMMLTACTSILPVGCYPQVNRTFVITTSYQVFVQG